MKSKNSFLYKIAECIAFPIYSVLVKTSIEGDHFIPSTGPIIIVSNHISFLDPIAMGYLARRRKRQVSFMAKDSLFKNPILRWFFTHCNQIPVSRNSENAKASLIHAEEALEQGMCIGLYPEATISDTINLLPIKSGAIRLAQKTNCEIVVIGTFGAHKVWTKGTRPHLKFRTKHAIIVSKGYKIDSDKDVEEAKQELAAKMSELATTAKLKLGK